MDRIEMIDFSQQMGGFRTSCTDLDIGSGNLEIDPINHGR